jgi:hypothetical protein
LEKKSFLYIMKSRDKNLKVESVFICIFFSSSFFGTVAVLTN